MPVRIVGMIGVAPPAGDATLHVIEGGLSPGYLTEFARAQASTWRLSAIRPPPPKASWLRSMPPPAPGGSATWWRTGRASSLRP